jgi:hypothetical protein
MRHSTSKMLAIAATSALIGMTIVSWAAGTVITGPVVVPNNSITFAKMQDIATARFIGRTTAGTGDPEALTGTQATAMLDTFTSGAKGLAPASGGGTANFLRADGTWAAPIGTGSLSISNAAVTTVNLPTEGTVDYFAATTGLSTPPRSIGSSSTVLFARREGGWIMRSFQFVYAGNSTFSNDTTTIGGTDKTNSASTEMFTATISSNTTCSRMFSVSSPTNGWGYSFTVPATTNSRTLKVYVGQFSDVITWTAHLVDGSAADVTTSTDSTSGAFIAKKITVTFKSAAPTDLVFTGFVTSRYTSDPNICFCAATVSEP